MDVREAFITELTSNQNRIYAFVLSLVGDPSAADDILQSVNLLLWRQASDWDPATNFIAWAITVARYEVMTWRKQAARNWLVFSDETLERLEVSGQSRQENFDPRQAVLVDCLAELNKPARELLRQRYTDNLPVQDIAQALRAKPNAVAQMLHRARQALARCMEKKIAAEGSS